MILTPIYPTNATAGGSGDTAIAMAAGPLDFGDTAIAEAAAPLDFGELLGLQLAQSAQPASDDSTDDNNQLAAAMAGAPMAVGSSQLPVADCKLPENGKTPSQARVIKTGNPPVNPLPAAPAGTEQNQRWNFRELAHHVQAAAGSLGLGEAPAGQDAIHAAPAAASFLAQASGERMRAAGTQNLMRALAQAGAQGAASETPAIQPIATGPEAQDAAGQFLASPDPRFKAAMGALAGSPKLQVKAADEFEFSPISRGSDMNAAGGSDLRAQELVFTPRVAGETRGVRTLPMIEQVRQVADFMAERTDGVIRLGQDSVQANLRLNPPDLGGVRVQLNVSPDRATQTQFIVERPETAALLQQHLRTYQQGLESHGLTVDRVQVTVQSARPASGGPDSGWRQQASPDDPRRQNYMREERGQNARRQNEQAFE